MTLPVPRDARERDAMLWAFGKGAAGDDRYVEIGELQCAADRAIPPVGEPTIDLVKPWALIANDGSGSGVWFATRGEAERMRKHYWGRDLVRLAVVEVIAPPDSWERLAKDAVAALRATTNAYDDRDFARRAALLAGRGE